MRFHMLLAAWRLDGRSAGTEPAIAPQPAEG